MMVHAKRAHVSHDEVSSSTDMQGSLQLTTIIIYLKLPPSRTYPKAKPNARRPDLLAAEQVSCILRDRPLPVLPTASLPVMRMLMVGTQLAHQLNIRGLRPM